VAELEDRKQLRQRSRSVEQQEKVNERRRARVAAMTPEQNQARLDKATRRVKDLRIRNKLQVMEAVGLKPVCSKCGYDKCLQALHFHHLDRSIKAFSLSKLVYQVKNLPQAIEEAKKCIILCANCHAELEFSD